MDEDLKACLKEMERELLAHTERELCAHTEAVESRLLREFWTWARQADARYRQPPRHGYRARRARG
jgi:hypothetical protein